MCNADMSRIFSHESYWLLKKLIVIKEINYRALRFKQMGFVEVI